tara:strand:- start:1425 stop:2606 length:1182 start_codon:yes stop_codon:yes gene_type:complete
MADEGQNDTAQEQATVPDSAPKAATGFTYGKCRTDHKSGEYIRKDYRSTDYMKDEPYASRVKEVLERMGLPYPKDEEIFRGTHHDMLFLDSHGVVIRIGHTDIEDLMNPGILQPLGWIDDKAHPLEEKSELPFTIAVYPGIELYKHYIEDDNRPELVGDLEKLFSETGQGSSDVSENNTGVIRMLDDSGKAIGLKILLDSDNRYNGSWGDKKKEKSSRFAAAKLSGSHKGEAMEVTLGSVFEAAQGVTLYQRAFQLHQPLRNWFWRAFKDEDNPSSEPDTEARTIFWAECAAVTNRPKNIEMHDTATYRMSDGKVVRSQQKKTVEVVLYRPWTGQDEDNVAKVRATLVANNLLKPAIKQMLQGELFTEGGNAVNPEPPHRKHFFASAFRRMFR